MENRNELYQGYVQILKNELIPAMGCTEPIALAYAAATAREVLNEMPIRVRILVSGNIIKNVKSVIVPNTGGMKGIPAAAAAGIVAGDASRRLEVLSRVTEEQQAQMKAYLDATPIEVEPVERGHIFDIEVRVYSENHKVAVRIVDFHTNIVTIRMDGKELPVEPQSCADAPVVDIDPTILNVEDIVHFADEADLEWVRSTLDRQIQYNMAIAEEGMRNSYGANVGKVLLAAYGDDVKVKARAYAAAGSDARMNGCEMPVVICSGSGNQGMTASIPVIIYARAYGIDQERLYRALLVSNLCTIHLKTGIGRLS
ncbi:MAG: serine dehydratase subunit alpha family protein, partial [Lachnospiraceae bacterium]|nr:serine dehydratase subunit alpha family protein [Lachnospiraceae bacterium]